MDFLSGIWLIASSPVWPLKELLLISAPYLFGRTGGYTYWLLKGRRSGDGMFWLHYYEAKPDGFWVPTLLLLTIQFSWVSIIVIANFLLDGRLLYRLGI